MQDKGKAKLQRLLQSVRVHLESLVWTLWHDGSFASQTSKQKYRCQHMFNSVSVTRFGDFLQFLATKFLTKVAQMIGNFLGNFEKPQFYVKAALATF